jgi:hypothetical protein
MRSEVFDRDGLFGADAGGFVALVAQLVGGLLLQHIEEVVVANLEHLGCDTHAQRVALALVEIDDDLEPHDHPPHDERPHGSARAHGGRQYGAGI